MTDFDVLLKSMLTKPPLKVLEKKVAARPSSSAGISANCDETQTHEDKFEDASLKPKYVFP